MIQKRWFRVVLLPDGTATSDSCEVDCKGKNGAVYRFYEASSLDEACKSAQEWFARRLTYQRERWEKIKASGMCPCGCGGPARPGKTTCRAHVDRVMLLAKERKAGRPLLKTRHPSASAAMAASKSGSAKAIASRGGAKGYVMRAMLLRFDALGPSRFRAWLVSEINKRSDAAHQIPTEEAQAAE